MANYPKSEDTNMYPSAYRGTIEKSGKVYVYDPEARLITEENMTRPYNVLADYSQAWYRNGSFVITYTPPRGQRKGSISFMLHGYYFLIRNFKPTTGKYGYAHITLNYKGSMHEDEDNTQYWALSLVPNGQLNQELDLNSEFIGLELLWEDEADLETTQSSVNNYYLMIIDKETNQPPVSAMLKYESSGIHIGENEPLKNHIFMDSNKKSWVKVDNGQFAGFATIGTRNSAKSVGSWSLAVGDSVAASGRCSYAEGENTLAEGIAAHAEGGSTEATDDYTHAEGFQTEANSPCAHAEGTDSIAQGDSAHAEGNGTAALGENSHAEGLGTFANYRSQHIFGEYNIKDNITGAEASDRGNYIEIVGNGTDVNSRSNARTLDWNGSEVLSGNLTVNGNIGLQLPLGGINVHSGITSNGNIYVNSTTVQPHSISTGQSGNIHTGSGGKIYTEGSGAIYTKNTGDIWTGADNKASAQVLLTNDGKISCTKDIKCGGDLNITGALLSSSNIDCGGYIKCDGDLQSDADVIAGGNIYSSNGNIYSSNANSSIFVGSNTANSAKIVLSKNGVIVRDTNATTTAQISNVGTITAVSYTATSDARKKENIADYIPEKSILDLPIKQFDMKIDGSHHVGCLAQDLEEIAPELVHEGPDGYLTIEENKLVYLLLHEVKQLKQEINELKQNNKK